jgi:ATP-dependent helicase HrpB
MLQLEEDNGTYDITETGLLLAYAYPERIASARPGNNAQFQLSNGKIAAIGHKDDLAHEPWLAVANVDLREGLGKIFLASPLNPKDLLPMVEESETVTWDVKKGGLSATKDLKLGSIVLQSKPNPKPDADKVLEAVLKAVNDNPRSLLKYDEEFEQLLHRISSLSTWNPDEEWPELTEENLFTDTGWLAPYLNDVKKNEDLKKINLADALISSLDWDKQQLLQQLAPEKIEVPSGSRIKIQYTANGGTPVLAVRLQEVFGVAETPTINRGKTKLLMHLLSPGYKPVQVTSDLKSFWNNLYFEVKKELQRRYPKHAWPDDPWSAKAVAKGRPTKQ